MATFGNPIVSSPNMVPSTAEVFSTSTAYSKGDYVWYIDRLYCFTADHAAGAWTGTDAAAAKLAEDVSGAVRSTTPYVSSTMTAPAALSVGDYVLADNTLYRVIAPVANGGTLTPNTNVVATTEADELKRKANTDGNYPNMTVGNAEQLISTVGVEDKVPYLFRTSGGSADIGDREVDELVGGTVAWNQMCGRVPDSNSGIEVTANADGSYTFSGTTTAGYNGYFTDFTTQKLIAGHKYLFGFISRNASTGGVYRVRDYTNASNLYSFALASGGGRMDGVIVAAAQTGAVMVYINVGSTGETVDLTVYPQLFDLTQMFGSAIADHLYALDTATPGAGAAWFRKLFPKDYYAYDAGTLMSVKTSAHKTVGFNAWDEEWELGIWNSSGAKADASTAVRSKNYIRIVPGAAYYVYFSKAPTNKLLFREYDANKQFIGTATNVSRDITFGDNVHFVTFCTYAADNITSLTAGDICINLSWDGERDGEYEPYEAHTYALDPDLELRGIPKLDADNKLYYDGDTYESDGTVTRKYGIVDLGTLNWTYVTNNVESPYFSTTSVSDLKHTSAQNNFIQPKYGKVGVVATGTGEGICTTSNPSIRIRDTAYTDKDTFKASLSGVYLVYELITPTTESADPYQNPQIVDDFGTEEYIDTRAVPIPVGHVTQYQANLRAKLEMAPNSPDGDGDYIVRQSNGQNTYVQLTFPADELPASPTTDGTYVLKATVSDGEATYSWVAET